jgi:hypothetical protein
MTSIPCSHAISAILFNGSKPEDYLHEYFSVETYKRAYDPMIFSIPSQDQWVRSNQDAIEPLDYRVAPGKPKKIRRMGPDELRNTNAIRKGGVVIRYNQCREVGHNTRTCPKRSRQAATSQLQRSSSTSIATEMSFNDVSKLF